MFNFGAAELLIVFLAVLPSLLGIVLAVWLVVTVLSQGRRIADLEGRVNSLERRGQTGA